jgi:hypothetical protein
MREQNAAAMQLSRQVNHGAIEFFVYDGDHVLIDFVVPGRGSHVAGQVAFATQGELGRASQRGSDGG